MISSQSHSGNTSDIDTASQLWPQQGSRHLTYLALIGGLLRPPHSWPVERVETLVTELAQATADEEPTDRVAIVAQTAQRLEQDDPCCGWPRLAELLGAENALRLRLAIDAALTVDVLAKVKQLPAEFLSGLGVQDAAEHAGYVLIPYRDAAARKVAERRRHSLATKPRWEKGNKAIAYGEDRLSAAVDDGYLTLCEGESDCWTLWFAGFQALGIPGAECARVLEIGHVARLSKLFVVREGDAAGDVFVDRVKQRLAKLGWTGELHVIRMTPAHKDVSALYTAAPANFAVVWRGLMDSAEPIASPPAAPYPVTPAPMPYRPFPVCALPSPLAEFVSEGAAALGCDPSYFALPVLAVAASMIGNSIAIRIKRDWMEPSVIWATVIGDSGTLKSPALRLSIAPVYRIQQEMLEQYQEAKTAYQAAKADIELEIKRNRKEGSALHFTLPDPPSPGRIVTGDVTIEKLGQLLSDNPRGMLVCRDELRSWFGSFTRYKGQAGGSDLPAWLEFFRAETVIIDRKSGDRPTLLIPRAAVSVCGGMQPGILARAFTAEAHESGLAARLLVAMPPKQPKRWSEVEIAPQTKQRYATVLRQLYAFTPQQNPEEELEPLILNLSMTAKQAWIDFYNCWASKQADTTGELSAVFSKLEAYAARFALIHHVVTHFGDNQDHSDTVERDSIDAGVTLARWFAYEAERVYTVCKLTDAERDVRRLLEYIQERGGEVTARILHQANRSRYPTPEIAEAALDALVNAGLGKWELTGGGPGRPSRKFLLRIHTPCPENPEIPTNEDTEVTTLATGHAVEVTPNGSPPCANHGEKGSFGVSGVWGTGSKQNNEPMGPPSDPNIRSGPFGVNQQEDWEIQTDEGEGELIL